MTSYRRNYQTGGTYFFTVNLADRRQSLLTDHIGLLRTAFSQTRTERWFKIDAMVILPDHLHAIWTLPDNDSDFSTRWRLIKTRFSRGIGIHQPASQSQRSKQERGIWQRRFWEHTIRNDADHRRLTHYCWMNPVKHGFVKDATDWPYSSIHRDLGKPWVQAPISSNASPHKLWQSIAERLALRKTYFYSITQPVIGQLSNIGRFKNKDQTNEKSLCCTNRFRICNACLCR